MKIALFGATGTIGQRILREALERGHYVTAIARNPSRISEKNEKLQTATGDATDADSIAKAVAGHDVVISTIGPSQPEDNLNIVIDAAHSLLEGLASAGVKRLLIVGGAASLEVAPGVLLIDSPDFPAAWKGIAQAQSDALEVYRSTQTDIDWTYISPAALIEPGERTGKYRTSDNQLVVNEKGESKISTEDYAVALLDEVENPQHRRKRFTVAY
jgi:putative NADH-flavin reductase